MRWMLPCLALAAACAPRWTQPEFREEVHERAIDAAVRDHACPREQVHVRCDASAIQRVLDGRLLVYDEGGVVGTYVDRAPSWEVELDVCGHLRRYRYAPPDPTSDAQEPGARLAAQQLAAGQRGVAAWRIPARLRGAPAYTPGVVEVARACDGAFCLDVAPACTSCARDSWWPVATTIDPALCADAADDPGLAIEVVDGAVELVVGEPVARELARACADAPLFVAVDRTWFALCGSGTAVLHAGANRIPTGLRLGEGWHTVDAFSVRDGACRRAPAMRVKRERAPPQAMGA